jgi:hypothetical protein
MLHYEFSSDSLRISCKFLFPVIRFADQSDRAGGLKQDLSSSAPTPTSWVRIPLKAYVVVFVYFVFVLSSVEVAALQRAGPASKKSYREQDYETEVKRIV